MDNQIPTIEKKFLLKDQLFNEPKVTKLATAIENVYPSFNKESFIKTVVEKFPSLELTQRIKWIRECLKRFLPDDYREATTLLLTSLPPHKDTDKLDNDFGEFIYAPYSDFVATYGCTQKDLHFSLQALKQLTTRFSAEDAIRYFINSFPKETLQELLKWSRDDDYHVRRLTSEGTRPRLPWSQKINTSLEDALPILDNLYSDKSRFVTRSVANHLNDIAKVNPNLVLSVLKKWQDSEKQQPKEMEYIINQSLRTLIKQGNKDAIRFLNFSTNPQVSISEFHIKKNPVTIGSALTFGFTMEAQKDEQLIVDYILYFQNKTGHGQNKKVFKLKKILIKKDQTMEIVRNQPMKHVSTRKLYPGEHKIELQINGNKVAEQTFLLHR